MVSPPFRNNLDSEDRDYERSSSSRRHQESSLREDEEAEQDYSEPFQPSCSQSYSPDHREKKSKRYPRPERAHETYGYSSQQGKGWGRSSPVLSSDQEYSDCGQAVSPEPSESPQDVDTDPYASEEQEEPALFQQKGTKGHSSFQEKPGAGRERGSGDSCHKGNVGRSKEHKSSHKKQRLDGRGDDRTSAFSPDRLHKASFKEQLRESPVAASSKEKQRTSEGSKKEKNRESGASRKEKSHSLPLSEETLDNHVKKQKHRDSEKGKLEKSKQSLEGSNSEKRKAESDSGNRIKEKGGSGSVKSSEGKRKISDVDKKSVGFSSNSGEGEAEDEFEQPTMSFESYLSYDQPQKKKKKVVKPSAGSAGDKDRGHSKQNGSKASTNSSSSSQKSQSHKRTSEKKAEKKAPEPPKPKRVRFDKKAECLS